MERSERLVWIIVLVMIVGIAYILLSNGLIGFGGTVGPPSSSIPVNQVNPAVDKSNPINGTSVPLVLSVGPAANSSCHYDGFFPDPVCSPGEASNDTLDVICVPGSSTTVRDVSESLKNQVYSEYGVVNHTAATYEIDHIIPLCAGGSNSIRNLFPQPALPVPGFHQKDLLEAKICRMICDNEIDLRIAQRKIAVNWLEYYNQLIGGQNVTNN